MTKFAFYSPTERKTLRSIKAIPTRKERKVALETFCKKYNRTFAGASIKMNKLNKARKQPVFKSSASGETTLTTGKKFTLTYKNIEIKGNGNGGEIVFTW